MSPPGDQLLALFAKHWTPGTVKTRLAATVGPQLASEFHRLSLATLLARLSGCGSQRRLLYTPRSARGDFAQLAAGRWQLQAQATGDLGQRLSVLIEQVFASSSDGGRPSAIAPQLVIIGADSPWLSSERIQQAFDRLQTADLVLGPAEDGGYYLLGVRGPYIAVVEGITWGGPQVLAQTLLAARRIGLATELLPLGYDVDRIEDLRLLREQLNRQVRGERSLQPLCRLLNQLVPPP